MNTWSLHYIGKRVHPGLLAAISPGSDSSAEEIIVCSNDYCLKPEYQELFRLTPALVEKWVYSKGISFDIHIRTEGSIINDLRLRKYKKYNDFLGDRFIVREKEEPLTKQEIRVAVRVLDYLTASATYFSR